MEDATPVEADHPLNKFVLFESPQVGFCFVRIHGDRIKKVFSAIATVVIMTTRSGNNTRTLQTSKKLSTIIGQRDYPASSSHGLLPCCAGVSDRQTKKRDSTFRPRFRASDGDLQLTAPRYSHLCAHQSLH